MSNLSIKDKNILLNEYFGWKGPKHPDTIASMENWISKYWGTWCLQPDGRHSSIHNMPKYFEDSAAIRKAKLSLTSEQRGYYIDHLANICRENSDGPATSIGKAFFATCEQEAEALGLTLNLWSGGLFEQSC